MLSTGDLSDLILDQLLPDWQKEKQRLDRIDRWYRWDPEDHTLPRSATVEAKKLLEISRASWLGLVVTSCAQAMYVDGYRSRLDPIEDASEEEPELQYPSELPWAPPKPKPEADPEGPWRIWLSNGLDKRQTAIHRAALAYGYSFVTVLPGEDPLTGEKMPRLRGVSPRNLWAAYEDPAEDDWPKYAMRILTHDTDTHECRLKLFDDAHVYTVRIRSETPDRQGKNRVLVEKTEQHGAGVCPVVRYCNELDLEGRTPGEVEPNIPLAARINKTSHDRSLAQHFNSWKIRWIAGLQQPETDEESRVQKMLLRQEDILVAEDPDTKFGSLPETSLDGFIRAHEDDIRALASVTQTPTHELTGQLVNLSAEALAAARASQSQKIYERQKSVGASHVQALRLGCALLGLKDYAKDLTGRVTWQDTSIRSLAQAVDALGKAAQMLQVPVEALWGRIPGVEKVDVEEWKRLALSLDPMTRYQYSLERQQFWYTPPDAGGEGGGTAASGSTPAKQSANGSKPAKLPAPKPAPKPAPRPAPKPAA